MCKIKNYIHAIRPGPAITVGRWRVDELDDIDAVAVTRAVDTDDLPPLTKGERYLAVVELHRRGMSQPAIGRRLHIGPRQVHRYLQVAGRTSTGRITPTEWAERTRARVASTRPTLEVSA